MFLANTPNTIPEQFSSINQKKIIKDDIIKFETQIIDFERCQLKND